MSVEKKKIRSSHQEVFLKKGDPKICSKFTGDHPCRSAISCNFIEIVLRHECSSVNLLHIFRKPCPKNTSGCCFWKILTFYIFNKEFKNCLSIWMLHSHRNNNIIRNLHERCPRLIVNIQRQKPILWRIT